MKLLDGSVQTRRLSGNTMIWLLIALGISVRMGYWTDLSLHTNHGFPNFYLSFGTPSSDARAWIEMGNAVREGWAADHGWAARRPLYGFILGSIYCWTDPNNQAFIAQGLNVIVSGVTVGLIFAAGYPVFGRVPALAAALWFCFDSNSIGHSTVSLSEIIGTMFTAWHLALLPRAGQGSWRHLAGGGLCLAAANITRTLSLFAFPTHCLLLAAIRWRATESFFRALWDASIFGGFASLLLIAAMARNQYVAGIFTISDNTASILYAATSPQYGHWTSAVEQEATQAGIHKLKDRYKFFMDKARANLSEHGGLYFSRVIKQTDLVLRGVLDSPFVNFLLLCTAVTIALQTGWSIYQGRSQGVGSFRSGLFLMVVIPVAWILLFPPIPRFYWIYSLASLAVIRSVVRNDVGLLHANLFFFSVLGVSGFGEYGLRFNLLFDFILVGLLFTGLSIVIGTLGRIVMRIPSEDISIEDSFGRGLYRTLSLGVLSIIAMGVLGIPSKTVHSPKPFPISPSLASQAVDQAIEKLPATVRERIRQKYLTQGEPISNSEIGRVIVVSGKLLGPATYAPPNAVATCRFACFKPRDYPRTILLPTGAQSNGRWRDGQFIISGTLSTELIGRPVVFVGIDRGFDPDCFANYMDGLAVFPWNENGTAVDWSAGYVSDDPHHVRVIESFLPPAAP